MLWSQCQFLLTSYEFWNLEIRNLYASYIRHQLDPNSQLLDPVDIEKICMVSNKKNEKLLEVDNDKKEKILLMGYLGEKYSQDADVFSGGFPVVDYNGTKKLDYASQYVGVKLTPMKKYTKISEIGRGIYKQRKFGIISDFFPQEAAFVNLAQTILLKESYEQNVNILLTHSPNLSFYTNIGFCSKKFKFNPITNPYVRKKMVNNGICKKEDCKDSKLSILTLVSELSSRSLSQYLNENLGSLSSNYIQSIIFQIMAGLSSFHVYLHPAGAYHLDLHLGNIIIQDVSPGGVWNYFILHNIFITNCGVLVKLWDFGRSTIGLQWGAKEVAQIYLKKFKKIFPHITFSKKEKKNLEKRWRNLEQYLFAFDIYRIFSAILSRINFNVKWTDILKFLLEVIKQYIKTSASLANGKLPKDTKPHLLIEILIGWLTFFCPDSLELDDRFLINSEQYISYIADGFLNTFPNDMFLSPEEKLMNDENEKRFYREKKLSKYKDYIKEKYGSVFHKVFE